MPLTPKQQRFVDAYTGNGVEAARRAGYQGSVAVLSQVAHENLRKPEIAAALKERQASARRSLIASREERQAFWTSTLRDEDYDLKDRLRASELLGKSEADFVEHVEHSGNVSIGVINPYADQPTDSE